MISPVLTVQAVGPIEFGWAYLDVQRLEQFIPPHVPVVAGWQQDFVKFMRYEGNPNVQYYFLLDWPAALVGTESICARLPPDAGISQQWLLFKYIQDSHGFLCSHPDFVVLDAPNANTLDVGNNNSPDMQKPNWFDVNIRRTPQFEWKVIDSFDASEVTRKLIAVHRRAPLTSCSQH